MPIRPELRPLYPPHWRELSSHVRFERAEGRCQRCGRPHLVLLRCLPDGRWFDEQAATWRDRRGRPARWPDLMEAPRFRKTRVVLAAAHLDSDPTNNRLKNSARALSTLPHTARSAAPFGPALDHLPPALGSRRSLSWSVPGNDRRADIKTDVARVHRGFASSRPPPSRGLPLKNGKKRPRPLQPEQPERRVRPNVQRNPNKAMRRGRVDAGAGFSEATIGIKAATNQIGAAKVLGSL